jgi:hypothetical protein
MNNNNENATERFEVQLEIAPKSGRYTTSDRYHSVSDARDQARHLQGIVGNALRVRTLDNARQRVCPVSTETWRARPDHEKRKPQPKREIVRYSEFSEAGC